MLPHDPVEAITERITQIVVQKYKISPGGNHLHRFPDLYFFFEFVSGYPTGYFRPLPFNVSVLLILL